MIFSIHNKIDIGPGYYKMNSSVVKDPLYRKEIEQIYREMNALQLDNPIDWWDLFAMVVRTATMKYCKEKSKTRKALKDSIQVGMTRLEAVDNDTMTMEQKQDLAYLKAKYDEIIEEEIKGHQIRTKGQPSFEINEPNIEYYYKLEQRSRQKNIITHLQDDKGKTSTTNEDMIAIAESFYSKLYTPSVTDIQRQQQLLRNIDKNISAEDRRKLDAILTIEELTEAVFQQKDGKSPGPDGITAEF